MPYLDMALYQNEMIFLNLITQGLHGQLKGCYRVHTNYQALEGAFENCDCGRLYLISSPLIGPFEKIESLTCSKACNVFWISLRTLSGTPLDSPLTQSTSCNSIGIMSSSTYGLEKSIYHILILKRKTKHYTVCVLLMKDLQI